MITLNPYHEVRDAEKLAALVASMAVDGWVGAPVVTDGEYNALTGSHRIAAASRVNDLWERDEAAHQIFVPTIDIREVWDEAGIVGSIDDILTYTYCDEYEQVCDAIRAAAPAVAEYYGLDIH